MIKKRNIRQALQWMRHFWGWLRRLYRWILRTWPFTIIIGCTVIHYLVLSALKRYNLAAEVDHINSIIAFLAQLIGLGFILYAIDSNLRLFKENSIFKEIEKWWRERPKFRPSTTSINLTAGIISGASIEIGKPIPNFQKMDVEEKLAYLKQEILELKEELKEENEKIRKNFDAKTGKMNERIDKLNREIRDINLKIEEVSIGGLDLQLFGVLVAAYGLFVDSFL